MLTKVKLRQKPLADGKLSLYLDFYPPITDQVTGKKTRREFLQLHIWEKPKGSLQRQHNADTLFVAEQIRFERENALLKSNIYSDLEKEHIAYLERSEKKFIEYYEESFKDKPLANWYRYSGAFYLLKKFCPKDIKFKDITLKWCENFRNFVLRADSLFHEGKTLAQTTRHNYFRCFRTILLQAFNEGYLRENLNAKLECIPRKDRPRQFLSVSELNQAHTDTMLQRQPQKSSTVLGTHRTPLRRHPGTHMGKARTPARRRLLPQLHNAKNRRHHALANIRTSSRTHGAKR